VSDVARYARRLRDVVFSSIGGFVLGAAVFEAVATVSAMQVGKGNFVLVMEQLGLLAPAVLLLVLALWNTADNNLYSSSLAFTNASRIAGVRIPRAVWTVLAVLTAVAVAFAGFADRSWTS
jgi:cytosine permease